MNSATHPASATCPNCQASTSGNFCHHCGQETVLHPASAREFLHEFIGHYVALEGRLWGTLGRLLFRPGALTLEYICGRRVRFVQPLRLYLTLSVLFFALVKFTSSFDLNLESKASTPGHAAIAAPAAQQADGIHLERDGGAEWLQRYPQLLHKWEAFEQMPAAEQGKVFTAGFYHYAPYAMFCLMPFFAFYLKLLYLGSGRRFGEHLLFALHSNAFAFAMFMAITALDVGPLRFLLWLWLLAYLPWAMRRVYQASRVGTAWRWLVLMAVYTVTMGIGFLLSLAGGVLTAGH